MAYQKGNSRKQIILFPQAIDDYITEENQVRFIDAFVVELDLVELGFKYACPEQTGRPPYDPGDLLKLYIYGYLNKVRSSRRLEKETQRNIEVMWLLRKLKPDFKTIADFRKDNRKAFKKVFCEFSLLCKKLDLFGGELLAIDGSKFKAVNGSHKNFTQNKLNRILKEIDEKIDNYLKMLDASDKEEAHIKRLTTKELKEKIEYLKDRKIRHEQLKEKMESRKDTQISLTDPDSRSMPKSPKVNVGYNVQTAVDARHNLIVEQNVTNDVTDLNQLSRVAIKAKEIIGVDRLKVVADKGYYNGNEVKKCEEENIEAYISKPLTSANTKAGLYGKEVFRYDSERDCYICPAGQDLTYRFDTVEKGRHIRYYTTRACKTCQMKSKCTRNKEGRRITRWVHEEILEQMEKRVASNPDLMKKRKMIVEHPFGTIKHWNDQGYFLMRGLEKVRAEMSLSALAYNIKRVINILDVPKMIQALA